MSEYSLTEIDEVMRRSESFGLRTPTSRRAGCEAHKSGSVRGAPARAGVPTRRLFRRRRSLSNSKCSHARLTPGLDISAATRSGNFRSTGRVS